ncbi:MAG: sulfotransferase domain-containing protein [Candidatus Schekmanbacteria bacterium]|nr:sulfotransferase domain-containing protein [Candidatus Schekmanbacteria bacterium]
MIKISPVLLRSPLFHSYAANDILAACHIVSALSSTGTIALCPANDVVEMILLILSSCAAIEPSRIVVLDRDHRSKCLPWRVGGFTPDMLGNVARVFVASPRYSADIVSGIGTLGVSPEMITDLSKIVAPVIASTPSPASCVDALATPEETTPGARRSSAFCHEHNDIIYQPHRPFDIRAFSETDEYILFFGLPRHGGVWITYLVGDSLNVRVPDKVTFTHEKLQEKHLRDKRIVRSACLMRDLRDAVVSSYYAIRANKDPSAKNAPIVHYYDIESYYFDFFIKAYMTDAKWHPWVDYVANLAIRGLPVLRYERLIDKPADELGRLFKMWNIEIPSESISMSIENNHIDKVRAKAPNDYLNRPKEHYRFGSHGHYKHELPKIVIDDINRRFGDYLLQWGYEL